MTRLLVGLFLLSTASAFGSEYMVNLEVYAKGKQMVEKKGKHNLTEEQSLKLDAGPVEMEVKLAPGNQMEFVFTTKDAKDKKVLIDTIPSTQFTGDFSQVLEGESSKLKSFGLEKIYLRIRNPEIN